MASIVKRANRYYVVYTYKNQKGKTKQKWESFRTKREAKEREQEIEFKKIRGTFVVPTCTTMKELLEQYV
ncbi:MAG: Arm DNA-binding domain-containing protein [Bilifractor sp.]